MNAQKALSSLRDVGYSKYSTDPDAALKQIVKTGQVALDLETTGLDPHSGQVGVVILESGGELYLLREVPSWMPLVLQDADTKKLVFNAKFDLQWLMGPAKLPYARNVQDLYLKELLVSTQRRGVKHNLQATLDRRLGVIVAKDVDHSTVDWTGPLSKEMEDYALEDIVYLADLDAELDRLLASTHQERAARIENEAVPSVAWMSLNGIGVDVDAWLQALRDPEHGWIAKADAAEQRLNDEFGTWNWGSHVQVRKAVVQKAGLYLPDTRRATIEAMVETIPSLQLLLDYKHWSKRYQNWGADFLETHVNAVTGRLHPSWWQIGTDTGRFACSAPNLQQIPRGPEFRSLFRSRPGFVIASLDYSQIEVLCAAVYGGDERLLEVFRNGGDTHTSVASMLLGVPPSAVSKEDRQLAKAVTFGLLFGGGAAGLVNYAKVQYKVTLELEEAQNLVRRFFDTFQGLKARRSEAYSYFRCDYCDTMRRVLDTQIECHHKPAMLEARNLVGMRRILTGETLKPTTYLNTIIQSTAGAGIKSALRRLGEAGLAPYLCLQVHDELVFEFPESRAEELAQEAKTCMVAGMREVLGNVPVGVDIAMGATWA